MGTSKRGRAVRPTITRVPDDLWEMLIKAIPKREFRPSGGRPRADPRKIVDGVLYVLRTGCQWKALPEQYGSGSTCHRRFQQWVEAGVWNKMQRILLTRYDELHGLDWRWQSADTSLHKAPLGGEKNGSQPHGSSQVRHQAARAHRGRRRADRARDHGRQRA